MFRNAPRIYEYSVNKYEQDYSHLIVTDLIKENFFKYFTPDILRSLPLRLNSITNLYAQILIQGNYLKIHWNVLSCLLHKELNSNAEMQAISDDGVDLLALLADAKCQ